MFLPLLLACAMAGTWQPPATPSASDTATDTAVTSVDDTGIVASRPPRAGDLVITEIMDDTDPTDDDAGEWFELRNVTGEMLALDGLTAADEDGEQVRLDTDIVMAPDDIVVVGASDDLDENGGVAVDLTFDTSDFHLGNDTDEIVIRHGNDTIDAVAYDDRFPHEKGRSRALDPLGTSAARNDEPGYWCEGSRPYGTDGNRGTPGLPNDSC
jgi:hypothetical protein